jgi:DNA helicase II / ATP-dependent DNA helicase PcrA
MHQLNPEQREAARFQYGIASVLAVPGSGKTFTMTQRIALMVGQGVAPESILGLTFTRNAADAMRQKLRAILGTQAKRVHLATIHSFCYGLLNEEGQKFTLLQGKDQLIFLKKIMKKCEVKALPTGMILREISLAKSNLIDLEEAKTLYQGDKVMQKIVQVREAYEAEKTKSNYLDFDDLLVKALRLLQSDTDVREKYQSMYNHILVDEFQDTNIAQISILKILIEKIKSNQASFWVCGDDWQSIYSFTGASVGNILNFRDQFPEASQYILNTNYRSTPQILEVCQNLISHNQHKVEKHLTTNNPDGHDVIVIEAMNEEDEAVKIVNEIKDLIGRLGYKHSDIAVLYRANYQSRVIEEGFSKYKIPYHIENGTNFFQRFEVRILLDYLWLINNPESDEGDEALKSVINIPNRYIGKAFVRDLETFAQSCNLHLYPALKRMPVNIGYLKHFLKQFREFVDPLITDKARLQPLELLHILRSGLDYDKAITDDDIPSPDDTKLANINQLQMVAGKYADIGSLLNYTDSFQANTANDKDGVSLMTVHKSKGLEFPVVFLIDMVEGIMPNCQGDLEEERRIAFVGLSRAMRQLYVCYPLKYMNKAVQKSPFLDEMFTGQRS